MRKTPITIFMDWFATESNAKKTLTDKNIQEINEKLEQLLSVEKELLEEFHRDGIGYQRYKGKWENVSTEDIYNKYFK
jgi:hypothetical protein